MPSPGKKRLDVLLVERGLASSRERAQALILAGQVSVAGRPAAKPGDAYRADVDLDVRPSDEFVGRGALKLARALDAFTIDPAGRIALDVGASTGGFTDLLLRRGAARVYAVDVGYGQLDYRLRSDPRVVVMERTNIRHLASLPERPSLAAIDVSFISLRLVLPAVAGLLAHGADVVALVKPQFEAGRGAVGRGVVRDAAVWACVLTDLAEWLVANGWTLRGLVVSPLKGASGNVEFLAHLRRGPAAPSANALVEAALAEADGRLRA